MSDKKTKEEWCQETCYKCQYRKDADLEQHRIYHLVGRITSEEYKEIMKFLDKAWLVSNKDPIHIVLESFGGDAASSFAIYDSIMNLRNIGIPVNVTAYGMALSGGAIILQAGATRRISRNCVFMIHEIVADIYGDTGQREDTEKCCQIFNNNLYRMLAERSGKTTAKIKKDLKRKMKYMTAEEVVEYGFADEIV